MNRNRKGSTPTQPECRPTTSKPTRRAKKSDSIIHRFMENFKTLPEKEKAAVMSGFICFASIIVLFILGITAVIISPNKEDDRTEPTMFIVEGTPTKNEHEEQQQTPMFTDSDGTEIDLETITNAWATEAGFEKRYNLTNAERWEVASVVTSEARGEPFAGKVAVAQCILQACEDESLRPSEALKAYKYTKHRPEPTEEALEAVQAVFDFGHVATNEPIKYFYNPNRTTSNWHESQDYVLTINNHKFFKEATK